MSENPYPKGTLAHDMWEFDRAKRDLGVALMKAMEPVIAQINRGVADLSRAARKYVKR